MPITPLHTLAAVLCVAAPMALEARSLLDDVDIDVSNTPSNNAYAAKCAAWGTAVPYGLCGPHERGTQCCPGVQRCYVMPPSEGQRDRWFCRKKCQAAEAGLKLAPFEISEPDFDCAENRGVGGTPTSGDGVDGEEPFPVSCAEVGYTKMNGMCGPSNHGLRCCPKGQECYVANWHLWLCRTTERAQREGLVLAAMRPDNKPGPRMGPNGHDHTGHHGGEADKEDLQKAKRDAAQRERDRRQAEKRANGRAERETEQKDKRADRD